MILAFYFSSTFANLLTGAVTGGDYLMAMYPDYGIDGDIHIQSWDADGLHNIYHYYPYSIDLYWWA